MPVTTETLWNYSIEHYALPGVAEACLRLQDSFGLDVNLVLCCLWFGRCHGELSDRQLDQLLSFSRDWSGHVVVPLRQVRRWIKREFTTLSLPESELSALRNHVKKLELEAERLQQDRLQAILLQGDDSRDEPGRSAMTRNLWHYLRIQGVVQGVDLEQLLESLLDALTEPSDQAKLPPSDN